MSNQEHTDGLTRRTLIKSTALGSLALAAGGLSLPFSLSAAAAVQALTARSVSSGAPVRSTAAAAAPCVHTCVTMKCLGRNG
jgi:nitrous oxide reductase